MSDGSVGAASGAVSGGGTVERAVLLVPEGTHAATRAADAARVVTPNPRAARAAGAPFRSLERLARGRLRAAGLQPAWPLAQWRALRRAVLEVLAPEDVDGTARAMASTLREVLRAGLPEEGAAGAFDGSGASDAPGASGGSRAPGAADPSGAGEPFDDAPRFARVVRVARAYRSALRERGLADPAEVLWCAARERAPDAPDARPWRVVGYPRIGPAEVAFLIACAPAGSALELPVGDDPVFDANRATARSLAAGGWKVEERTTPAAPPDPPAGVRRGLRFPSRDAEIRFALTEVKRLLAAGEEPDGIVLVARDDAAYGAAVLEVAWEYELPVAVGYGVPLRDTRVGAWTDLLLEAVREGLPFETVARLLTHPLGGGLTPSTWETARRTHPRGLAAWRELEARAALLDWPGRAPRGAYLACVQRVWEAFGLAAPSQAGGAASRPPAEDGGGVLFPPGAAVGGGAPAGGVPAVPVAPGPALAPADAVAFQRLAVAAAGAGVPATEAVPLSAFLRDVEALLALVTAPADTGPPGRPDVDPSGGSAGEDGGRIELHTPLAVYGARYRHVFVLGAAEGTLPATVRDDPVLDFAERERAAGRGLPLEGAVEAARREALSFRAVLWTLTANTAGDGSGERSGDAPGGRRGAAPGATFTMSYPEDSGIASPYFAALGLEPTAPGRKPPASDEERRRRSILRRAGGAFAGDPVLEGARRAWAVERRREEAVGPDAHDGVVGESYRLAEHVFSATQLLDLGQCAFRWLARVPLSLAEPQEAEEDVTPLLRGRLYHRTLELALRRGRDAAGAGASAGVVRGEALAALEEAFAEAEEAESAVSVPAWPLRRAYHLEALRRVLAADSFLPDGAEVVAIERRFPDRGAEPPRWRGFPVRGIVDRIDRRHGGLVLLDYKTRSSPPAGAQDAAGKARLDVQLPVYLEAAATALFPRETVRGAQYYSLTKGEVLAEIGAEPERDADLAAFADRVRGLLEAGRYPVAPDVDQKACRTCDFDLLCRKGPRTERMRAGGAFDDASAGAGDGGAGGRPYSEGGEDEDGAGAGGAAEVDR